MLIITTLVNCVSVKMGGRSRTVQAILILVLTCDMNAEVFFPESKCLLTETLQFSKSDVMTNYVTTIDLGEFREIFKLIKNILKFPVTKKTILDREFYFTDSLINSQIFLNTQQIGHNVGNNSDPRTNTSLYAIESKLGEFFLEGRVLYI